MKGPGDLRKETADAMAAERAAAKAEERRNQCYADTFEGGQLAALMDVREAFKLRGGRDHTNILNEMVAYLNHRIDPEGCDLPDTPTGYPEPRTATNPPSETPEDEGEGEKSEEGGEALSTELTPDTVVPS